jgi:hypothetical protein
LSDGNYKIVLIHQIFPLNDELNIAVLCKPNRPCGLARTMSELSHEQSFRRGIGGTLKDSDRPARSPGT